MIDFYIIYFTNSIFLKLKSSLINKLLVNLNPIVFAIDKNKFANNNNRDIGYDNNKTIKNLNSTKIKKSNAKIVLLNLNKG